MTLWEGKNWRARGGKDWPTDNTLARLLKCAGIPNNPETRKRLRDQLRCADFLYRFARAEQHRIPQEAYTRVAMASKELLSAMSALSRYTRPHTWLGGGPGWIYINTAELDWMNESDRGQAVHSIKMVWAAVDEKSRSAGSPKRGQPQKRGQTLVVLGALDFLRKHAAGNTVRTQSGKMRLPNKHREFIELFYETATGEKKLGKLEWQIKNLKCAQ
jgi:hypothetical protein